jgi:hypothetical protein
MNRLAQEAGKKKPYQAPKLLVYGNLTEMTQSLGGKGKKDSATRGLARQTGR